MTSSLLNTGHAALWSRADWREHLKIVAAEIGFKHVRGHGILDNAVMFYDACPNDGKHTHANCPNPPCDAAAAAAAPVVRLGRDTMTCIADKNASMGSYWDVSTMVLQFIPL